MISFKEKKALTIKLIKQGHSQRDIAKQTHLSFKTISEIRKELECDTVNSKNKKQSLSMSSRAFMLFEENKSLVQVSIELDLPSQDILNKHSEYLKLKNRHKIDSILKENHDDPATIELIDLLSENNININDIIIKVTRKNDFDNLKLEFDKLEVECFCAKEAAQYWKSEFYKLNDKYMKFKKNNLHNF